MDGSRFFPPRAARYEARAAIAENFAVLASCWRARARRHWPGAGDECMTRARIALPLILALAFAGAGLALVPRPLESGFFIASQDDPVALADHAVARVFDAATAAREIDAALAAGDADLARSFLELARDRNVQIG